MTTAWKPSEVDRHLTRFGTVITGLHWRVASHDRQVDEARRARRAAYSRGEVDSPELPADESWRAVPGPGQLSLF